MTPRGGGVAIRVGTPVGATKLDPIANHGATDGYADFTVVYNAHRTAIYSYVRRLVANEADAEDLTVTAFEKALRAWERRPPVAEMRPWLFRIATNACLDELRRRKRVQWQPWSTFTSLFHPSQVATDDPEGEALRHEKAGVIRSALALLPPRDRAALILREYQGLPVDDIGRALGISRGAAKITLFRARERLRSAYLQLGGELPHDYWTDGARQVSGRDRRANGGDHGAPSEQYPTRAKASANEHHEANDSHE
ncbi:MAG: RNA polymerase sigma factor [Chloroflexota bacterium]